MGDDASYLGQFRYAGDRYGLEVARLGVGDAFNPEIGFLPRRGFTRNYAFARFSPRPARWPSVRELGWEASIDRIAGASGELETLEAKATFRVIRATGDEMNATFTSTEDVPRAAFGALGTRVPAGRYEFRDVRATYVHGPQRPIVGTITAARGGFYGGDKTEVGYSGRLPITPRFTMEPSLTLTWLSLPHQRVSARLIGSRMTVAMTPRMFAAALIQYNSITGGVGSNVRFRWEYRPGSDLFVVYSEARDTRAPGLPSVNRALAIKFTRLLRM